MVYLQHGFNLLHIHLHAGEFIIRTMRLFYQNSINGSAISNNRLFYQNSINVLALSNNCPFLQINSQPGLLKRQKRNTIMLYQETIQSIFNMVSTLFTYTCTQENLLSVLVAIALLGQDITLLVLLAAARATLLFGVLRPLHNNQCPRGLYAIPISKKCHSHLTQTSDHFRVVHQEQL